MARSRTLYDKHHHNLPPSADRPAADTQRLHAHPDPANPLRAELHVNLPQWLSKHWGPPRLSPDSAVTMRSNTVFLE